jgi:hypothetical protein
MNATGEPGESFKASVTPEPGPFGTMSFHTAWENPVPLPEPLRNRPPITSRFHAGSGIAR